MRPQTLGWFLVWNVWVLLGPAVLSATIHLAWDPSVSPGELEYTVYYGRQSGVYTTALDVGPATSVLISGLHRGPRYYFAVSAALPDGPESAYSNEVTARAHQGQWLP